MIVFIGIVGVAVTVMVAIGMVLITPYGTVDVDDPDQGSELSSSRSGAESPRS